MSDFLPAMVSIGILAASCLLAWNLDIRNVRPFPAPEQPLTEDVFLSQPEDAGPF